MIEILEGDALERLRELADESVQCCVTSPPYWGLRDYGTAAWEGGDDRCDHIAGPAVSSSSTLDGGKQPDVSMPFRGDCGKCGAKRIDSQLGLERTPEEYVGKMVEVFREVRRVLRKDGTLWLNLGDSYASSRDSKSTPDTLRGDSNGTATTFSGNRNPEALRSAGLKHKDLCGIPWRVAFALQADGAASPAHMRTIERMISAITASYDTRDEWPGRIRSEIESLEREWMQAHEGGWWLRSDIIWAKPNPMPESVTDRPTKSHEYLFLLTKSASYFYDAEAIKEQATKTGTPGHLQGGNGERAGTREGLRGTQWEQADGRNKRSVWTVATAPYPEAHFATYPPDLIKPCIMAGTSAKGCCAKCGAPWERIVERDRKNRTELDKDDPRYRPNTYNGAYGDINGKGDAGYTEVKTLGWQPTCSDLCTPLSYPVIPCTVLDPFAGSGTTGMVALELGRKAVLIELNPKYVELIEQRCDVTMGLQLA